MSDAAPALGTPDLADRVNDVKAWALSRIRTCREQETKFAGAWKHREKHHTGPPQALVEAWTERRALQAVLKMLSPGYLERVEHGYGHTGDGDQRIAMLYQILYGVQRRSAPPSSKPEEPKR